MFNLTPYNKRNLQNRRSEDDFYSIIDNFFNQDFSPMRDLERDTFKVDIKDEGDKYIVEAELPGIKKEEVLVDYDDGKLTIGVERKEEVNEENDNYIHRERRMASMQRCAYLNDVDIEKIDAKLEDGLLSVTAPKIEGKENKKRIDIK
ncbi:MAG: Hsp20/alpha crystallin family protein [Eubacteriales bacterium]